MKKGLKILAIETSADETSVSVMEVKEKNGTPVFKVLGHGIASQIKLHREYGGIYPSLAKREHAKNLPIVFKKALKQAKIDKADLIAVTYGPGLEPALWQGIVFAKELSKKWGVSIVPVNHMEGHILSVFGKVKGEFKIEKPKFPVLSLLVSGGHTELVFVKDWGEYKIIGSTRDDAAGEAFDKVARMLDLPYPGGPEISKLAEVERKNKKDSSINLPRPMMYTKDYDFSFSGLKTAVLYYVQDHGPLNKKMKSEIAHEFENAVVETLVYKTMKAIKEYNIKTLIVGGGVSANKHLQKTIKKEVKKLGNKVDIRLPSKNLSTDNSIMIGIAGYANYLKKGLKKTNIAAEGNLSL